ncbi:MAG: glycosyltransferase [Anaerolineales bacterium]|nr:glycosyltransferase [Anaerolineales bacterium]
MSKYPLVTVITPTYNRAAYLPETIKSVLTQDYPNIEYIVLDDGSTDNTREVLEKYKGQFVWESHPNIGETRTVNKGVGMAHGDYVLIVNSDDPILPGLICETANFLNIHQDVLVAYPDWIVIDEQSVPLRETRLPEYSYLEMLRWQWCQPGPGALIRRKAWMLAGERASKYKYVADFEFWLRLGLYGPFVHIPKILATWRWHAEGASIAHRGLLMAQEHIALVEDIYSWNDLPPEAPLVRSQALSAAYNAAAESCLPQFRNEARRYLLRSLSYYPLYPLVKPHRSLTIFIEILLGPAIAQAIRSLLSLFRRKRSTLLS